MAGSVTGAAPGAGADADGTGTGTGGGSGLSARLWLLLRWLALVLGVAGAAAAEAEGECPAVWPEDVGEMRGCGAETGASDVDVVKAGGGATAAGAAVGGARGVMGRQAPGAAAAWVSCLAGAPLPACAVWEAGSDTTWAWGSLGAVVANNKHALHIMIMYMCMYMCMIMYMCMRVSRGMMVPLAAPPHTHTRPQGSALVHWPAVGCTIWGGGLRGGRKYLGRIPGRMGLMRLLGMLLLLLGRLGLRPRSPLDGLQVLPALVRRRMPRRRRVRVRVRLGGPVRVR